eukprot:TRINITY_DN11927_c0_g3_i1.p1 TRINITY_DN11927_c0_g3~~TRINITY_DN11927_c0_g3_i1.p1  ORF type:complete len:385 (+),score=64.69 TRINITY_DN11927_c0_g3_i1:388-1542(+)
MASQRLAHTILPQQQQPLSGQSSAQGEPSPYSPAKRKKNDFAATAIVGDDAADDSGDANSIEEMSHQPEKKRRLTEDQVRSLERMFELESRLEPERKEQLARELGLEQRQVSVWFQNRRARWKSKQLESNYGVLKKDYDAIVIENQRLRAELAMLEQQRSKVSSMPCARCMTLDLDMPGSPRPPINKSAPQPTSHCSPVVETKMMDSPPARVQSGGHSHASISGGSGVVDVDLPKGGSTSPCSSPRTPELRPLVHTHAPSTVQLLPVIGDEVPELRRDNSTGFANTFNYIPVTDVADFVNGDAAGADPSTLCNVYYIVDENTAIPVGTCSLQEVMDDQLHQDGSDDEHLGWWASNPPQQQELMFSPEESHMGSDLSRSLNATFV